MDTYKGVGLALGLLGITASNAFAANTSSTPVQESNLEWNITDTGAPSRGLKNTLDSIRLSRSGQGIAFRQTLDKACNEDIPLRIEYRQISERVIEIRETYDPAFAIDEDCRFRITGVIRGLKPGRYTIKFIYDPSNCEPCDDQDKITETFNFKLKF